MLIEYVDSCDLESPQRGVGHLPYVLGPRVKTIARSVRVDAEAELRGDDYPVADRRERLSNQLLVSERTVRLRSVKKRYAALDRRAQNRNSGLSIGAGTIDRLQPHRAVTKRGNFRPESPQLTRLHCCPRC